MARDVRTEPSGLPPGDDPAGRLLQAVEVVFTSSGRRAIELARPKSERKGTRGPQRNRAEDALRDEVRDYVVALRRDGATPERVLVAVKDLVRRALPTSAAATRRSDADALLTRIVEWTVSDYYRAD